MDLYKKAELAKELGFVVCWELEQGDWMDFAGDPRDEYEEKFESGEWLCFVAYVKCNEGTTLSCLGGIILKFNDKKDKIMYETELLAEAIDTLKKG